MSSRLHWIVALAVGWLVSPIVAETVLWAPSGQSAVSGSATVTASASSWIGVWLVDEVDGGARIVALVPGGPAERASLRVGDIIVQANAQPVPKQDTLTTVLQTLNPGEPLVLQVIRDGSSLERRFEVAARPTRPPVTLSYARPAQRGLDIEVSEITPGLREHYGAPSDAGVLVVRTDPGGVGGRSGIEVGDVLVRVGDQPIVNSRQVQWLFWQSNAEQPLEARVVRDGKTKTVRLTALETSGQEAQDGKARRRSENELVARRLKLELERLERRMKEIRRELDRLEVERKE